jgi:hypothetical protein
MTPKTLLARDPALLSESQWSGLVLELARLGGWSLRYHTWTSKRSSFGFPDWVLCKPPRLVFAELKAEAGKLSDDQEAWLAGLREVEHATRGLVQAYVWRPSDYPEVVEILTGRRPASREEQAV